MPEVVHHDLDDGLPRPEGEVHAIWWRGGVPVGEDRLPAAPLPPRALADRIARRVEPGERPVPPPAGLTVTVAVCTRDRPDDLDRCLAALAAARDVSEIVVVDNGREPLEPRPGIRRLSVPGGGLSAARNAAVEAATTDVVAFVDEDAEVHPGWLAPLLAPFADPSVMASCGLVLPAELATDAQEVFETELGGLGRGYRAARYGPDFLAARRTGAPVWAIGAGANMAVRREALELVGPFDERLGAGAAGAGEDSELWYRLLAQGWTVAYEPASVVFHHHRRARAALEAQAETYLRGHVAALFVQFGRFRHWGNLTRAFAALPASLARATLQTGAVRALAQARSWPGRPPGRPVGAEWRGYARGLTHVRYAAAPAPRHKASLHAFLATNPFPHPLTEGFFYREKMRAIHRVCPDRPFADVLEIGGGRSGLAAQLFPHARIVNTDLDPAHAAAAVNASPRITFQVADATALPFADASFDVVTLLDVLEHIPDDGAAAREALRVLRPGGWVLASSPNHRWRSPYHRAMAPISPTSEEMIARWEHVRLGYSREDFEALFGLKAAATADFITPVTVIAHDLGFSRLPGRVRRALIAALAPVTWLAYAVQSVPGRGTETAVSFRKP